ncbi:hypothetical protein EDC50_2358 [Vulcaniibacterium tengchongense]|uniref:Uncharacterized protein n=1 Tax=Vulcaniibacterium tengchongense TaxID=1273429 RepID=A0A3N4VBN6_9GAMM|nr:hypothetical protein EDC50_2358 [Vulcaniibacterium tengchongense]
MRAPAPGSPPPARGPRRRRFALTALAAALLVLPALRWVSQPSVVAGAILGRAGAALGLEIEARGASEYRLRGTPRLVLREVTVREPGAATPLLRAERIALEVPWATLRSRGADLALARIELDAPRLELGALQRWQAKRPPGPAMRWPRLGDGLRVTRGTLLGDGWRIEALDLDLPSFHPDRPGTARLQGRARFGTTRVPFALHAALTRPRAGAGLGVAGGLGVETPGVSLPMRVRLSGRVRAGADGLGLDALKFGAQARYRGGGAELPFALGLAGPLRYRGGALALAPLGVALRGGNAIPTLDAHGALRLGGRMDLRLQGVLADWPAGWPALPAPLDRAGAPLPFALDYRGGADFSGPAALQLRRAGAEFDGGFRLPELLAWVDAGASPSPLPPLRGRLRAPALELAGARLEGVEVEFDDAGAAP